MRNSAMINWIKRLFGKPESKKPIFRFKNGKFVSSYVIYDKSIHPGVISHYAAIWQYANTSPFDTRGSIRCMEYTPTAWKSIGGGGVGAPLNDPRDKLKGA